MNDTSLKPPKNAVRLFRWYCSHDREEELLGDLEELYYDALARGTSSRLAKWQFWWNVVRCCKPYAFKNKLTKPSRSSNPIPMLHNYFKVITRSFKKNQSHNLLNLTGLAVGFAAFILVMIYVNYERSFENFHSKAEHINRLTVHYFSENGYDTHFARVNDDWVNTIPEEIPEVRHLIRFQNHEPKFVSIGESKFTQENAYTTDAAVFEVFDFELLQGDKQTALIEPYSVVISQALALKYFGTSDVLGQEINITRYWMAEEERYKITGLMKDLPSNTHLPVEMLTSYRNEDERTWWAYTYLLLQEGADLSSVKKKVMALLVKNNGEEALKGTDYVLQPMKDIHLQSDLAREIKPNGSIAYVRIFFGVAIFILLIAMINFMNLSSAIALGRAKEIGLRKVLGSSYKQLIYFSLTESVLFSLIAAVAGCCLAFIAFPHFKEIIAVENLLDWPSLAGIMLCLALTIGLISGFYPAFVLSFVTPISILKSNKSLSIVKGQRGISFKKALVTGQFAICILLVGSAFIGRQQFAYISSKNLGITKDQVIAIQSVPDTVKDKFEVFKNELSQKPGIVGVSACLEVPSREIRDGGNVDVDGMNLDKENLPSMDIQVIDHDFVDLMGLELLAGEALPKSLTYAPLPNFDSTTSVKEYLLDKRRAYIINETAMQKIGWQHPEEAIGQQMSWTQGNYVLQKGPIVGVVKDFHQETLKNTIDPLIMVFEPLWLRTFLVKVDNEQINLALPQIESTWNELFPLYPYEYVFLDELFEKLYKNERKQLQLLYTLSGLAILIAFMGLFGLVAYSLKTRNQIMAEWYR